MSKTANLFSFTLRLSTRLNANVAPRATRTVLTRRMMSSESHASHGSTSSDTPWMVCFFISACCVKLLSVFSADWVCAGVWSPGECYHACTHCLLRIHTRAIQFLYLVSPSARKGNHAHADHGHKNHRVRDNSIWIPVCETDHYCRTCIRTNMLYVTSIHA